MEEIVVGGYRFFSKNKNSFENKEKQLLAVYKSGSSGSISAGSLMDVEMNDMMSYGYYENDEIHPRAAVATVAFNGQNGRDLVFFNGEIFTYNDNAGFEASHTPSYFTKADNYAGSSRLTNSWVSDVAVGNFDHNAFGREQVYFVIALKTQSYEEYSFKVGMIGAQYKDTNEYVASVTGAGAFYSSDIDGDNYQLLKADGYLATNGFGYCSSIVTLAACDINDDGIRMRYRGKNFIYSDPKVEAVLQALLSTIPGSGWMDGPKRIPPPSRLRIKTPFFFRGRPLSSIITMSLTGRQENGMKTSLRFPCLWDRSGVSSA